jgi:hypothetical protein
MNCSALKEWLPYKLLHQSGSLLCRWLYVGEKRFVEPFFDETISKCLSHPNNSGHFKCTSHIDLVTQCAPTKESLRPSAFIFHVSRCGSTLLSQLLSLSPRNIVLSEVPFLDEMLRLSHKNKGYLQNESDHYFQSALSFYGMRRALVQQNLFIKTDSWHIMFYDRLRKLFPDVPFVLLYRNPLEVLLSHQRKKGMHAVPGLIEPEIFGFGKEELKSKSLDVYLAQVLEKYFTVYLQSFGKDKNVMLVNYNEGMMSIMKKIDGKVGMSHSEHEWEMMKERAGFDAKYPNHKFSEEQISIEKPGYLDRCFILYEQLEKCTKSQ